MTIEQDNASKYVVQIDGFDPDQFRQSSSPNNLNAESGVSQRTLSQPDATNRETDKKHLLAPLLERERILSDFATRSVVFTPPLISRNDTGIIGRGTLNIIQGAYGSHKSRLAELLAALMLTDDPTNFQFLMFERTLSEQFCICYIDTERNQREELPAAIQGIKLRAGYSLTDQPSNFRFTSIKATIRAQRFEAIEAFISHVRGTTDLHLFILIDVVTDAVGDFNDPKESMRLYDFIGNLCDRHNATFLLVIHQNPGSEKARGHTGTEAANKASTVLQIGFEKNSSGNDSDLIRLRYLKLRRGKRPEPVYLQFCKESNGLILADQTQIAVHAVQHKPKADSEDIADRLVSLLADGPMNKGDVVKRLETEFGAKSATIRDRLKSVKCELYPMFDEKGSSVRLDEFRKGRDQFYQLIPKT